MLVCSIIVKLVHARNFTFRFVSLTYYKFYNVGCSSERYLAIYTYVTLYCTNNIIVVIGQFMYMYMYVVVVKVLTNFWL